MPMKKLLCTFALLLTATSANAQTLEEAARGTGGFPVRPGIWRLDGIDPNLGTADLEPLRGMIGKAPVVALGESAHTSGGFYVLKHRVFRYLVETMGFRVFAIESSWSGTERTDRYVQTCEGDPREVLLEHHGVWLGDEVADLLRWMCEWNRAHPDPADKVHYFGFDVRQARVDGLALIDFLQRTGVAADHPWIAGIRFCEEVTEDHPQGEVPAERYTPCVRALSAVDAHFQRNRAEIVRRTSERDFTFAKLHLVGLRAEEDLQFLFNTNFAAAFSARDAAMAYAFQTLRAMKFPKARTMIWAANVHVARSPRLPNGERPMGSYLAAALGRNYVSFGLAAHETEIDVPRDCGPTPLASPSIEEQLFRLGEDYLLVDMARDTYLRRIVYTMPMFRFRPHRDFDGLFYLERSERMHPFRWAPCPG
jgi:erythromycin esterase-like protein